MKQNDRKIPSYGKRTDRRGYADKKQKEQFTDRPEETVDSEYLEGMLEGRNAVQEALRSGRTIDKVFIAAGDTDRNLARLAAQAKEAGAVVVPVDRRKLDQMSQTHSHQGIIAQAAAHAYATLDEVFEAARQRGEEPLIVVCDELSDPHNLGAILRSAECAGAHGVVIPKRRSVALTPVVAKASAGAVEYMPVVRVANIPTALKEMQERGVWVYGTAADGEKELYEADLKGGTAIVIGNEGVGMGRLVRETCDVLVRVPMKGRISSLNASATAAILLYEAVRQRR